MLKSIGLATALVATTLFAAIPAQAQNYPLEPAGFMEVTGIHLEDGGAFPYATFLAAEWRRNQEFAKSKGWITDYKVYTNMYPREGEPDLYLATWFPSIEDADEAKRRQAEYREYMKKSDQQLDQESGNRTKFRTVGSSMLLGVVDFVD